MPCNTFAQDITSMLRSYVAKPTFELRPSSDQCCRAKLTSPRAFAPIGGGSRASLLDALKRMPAPWRAYRSSKVQGIALKYMCCPYSADFRAWMCRELGLPSGRQKRDKPKRHIADVCGYALPSADAPNCSYKRMLRDKAPTKNATCTTTTTALNIWRGRNNNAPSPPCVDMHTKAGVHIILHSSKQAEIHAGAKVCSALQVQQMILAPSEKGASAPQARAAWRVGSKGPACFRMRAHTLVMHTRVHVCDQLSQNNRAAAA